MLESPNPTTQLNKPRLGQGTAGLKRKTRAPTQVQMQVQSRNESQISKQKEGLQAPFTRQTTDRHIEQRPETCIMSKHTIRPKVTAM